MNAPGSPSSALQTMYFCPLGAFMPASHLTPVGKPAPPRPRRPDFFISSTTCSGVMEVTALAMAP